MASDMDIAEKTFDYLLDVLNIPVRGEIHSRVSLYHREILNLSRGLKISSWISYQALGLWRSELDPIALQEFENEYKWGMERAASLMRQSGKIAELAGKKDIPCVFIKGAAALGRGFLPFGCRNMSDIDVLTTPDDADRFVRAMIKDGYFEIPDSITQIHHHPSLAHERMPAPVEIHTAPYPVAPGEENHSWDIISNAVEIDLLGQTLLVPCNTHHAWILMRTDPLSRPYLPRIGDVIELDGMLRNGADVSFEVLNEFADRDGMPGILTGMQYSLEKFSGISFPRTDGDHRNQSWEKWSLYSMRKFQGRNLLGSSRERFAALMYYPDRRAISKWIFLRWMIRSIIYIDRFVPGMDKPPSALVKFARTMKVVVGILINGVEYAVIKCLPKYSHKN